MLNEKDGQFLAGSKTVFFNIQLKTLLIFFETFSFWFLHEINIQYTPNKRIRGKEPKILVPLYSESSAYLLIRSPFGWIYYEGTKKNGSLLSLSPT